MNINFRRAQLDNPQEMRSIAEIDMTIPALFDSLFQVNEKTIADRIEQLMKCKADDFFDVAVNSEGKIIAYHFMNKFESIHLGWVADVQTLWVEPDYRKQGIATALKQRGEAWAKEQKLNHISTFVHAKNSSMLELNENLGYELVGYKLKKNSK